MSNFQKLSTGVSRQAQIQGTDIGSGAATSTQFHAANGSGGSAFRSIVSGDIPTLNQNTTGTASNVTATSNATLTTLSALTTASSLVTVGTITSGTWSSAISSASPSFSGTLAAAAGTFSSTLTITGLLKGNNQLMLGTTDASSMFAIDNGQNQSTLSGTTQSGATSWISGTTAATTAINGFKSSPATQAGAFTNALMVGFNSAAFGKGAGSAITRAISFFSSGIPTAGTNNALLADNSAFTGNFFINQSGTDAIVFGGAITGASATFGGAGTALTVTNNAQVSGTLGVSTGPSNGASMIAIGGMAMTNVTTQAINAAPTIPSTTTTAYRGYLSDPVTQATAFTIPNLYHFAARGVSLGAGSAVTRQIGFYGGESTALTTATNNAVLADNIAFTGNFFIHQSSALASSFGGSITAANFSGTSSGTNTGDQTITLTSDVTGSGTGSFATTIAANAVTNAKAAQMATLTIKGNNTGGTANAADLTVAQVLTMLGQFSGKTTISSASTSQAVTFSTAYANTSYSVTANLLNTTDVNPQFQPITITAQATTGFTAKWNMPTDTANYVLSWQASLSN